MAVLMVQLWDGFLIVMSSEGKVRMGNFVGLKNGNIKEGLVFELF